MWQAVYGFRKDGYGLKGRKDDFARELFDGRVDAKKRFSVEDCRDKRVRAVLAFLLPIFYPEKPHRLTITWANTIVGSFQGKREVQWGLLLNDVISKLLKALPKAKITPLSSYLPHLYRHKNLLTPEEQLSWTTQEKLWSYGDIDSDSVSVSGESEPQPVAPPTAQPGSSQQTPERSI